jgi:hypothetical protein
METGAITAEPPQSINNRTASSQQKLSSKFEYQPRHSLDLVNVKEDIGYITLPLLGLGY